MKNIFTLCLLFVSFFAVAQDDVCENFPTIQSLADLEKIHPDQVSDVFSEVPENTFIQSAGTCILSQLDYSAYSVPDEFIKKTPLLLTLILQSRSVDSSEEKQNWFNLLPLMNNEQIIKLYEILTKESRKLAAIEEKYDGRRAEIQKKYLDKWENEGEDGRDYQSLKLEECQWIKETEPDNYEKFEECEYKMDILYVEDLHEKGKQTLEIDEKQTILSDVFYLYEVIFLEERKNFNPPFQKDFSKFSNLVYELRREDEDQQTFMHNTLEMIDYRERYIAVLDSISNQVERNYYNQQRVSSYGNLSYYYLFSRDFYKSIDAANLALSLDPTQVWIKTNLGHAYLFTDRYKEAVDIYDSIKRIQDPQSKKSFKDILIEDFDALERAGITHEKIERIKEKNFKNVKTETTEKSIQPEDTKVKRKKRAKKKREGPVDLTDIYSFIDLENAYPDDVPEVIEVEDEFLRAAGTHILQYLESDKYTIEEKYLKTNPLLISLVIQSKSMDTDEEKQSWFNLLPLMNKEQIDKLYSILTKEVRKLAGIEDKYNQKKEEIRDKYINGLNGN